MQHRLHSNINVIMAARDHGACSGPHRAANVFIKTGK